MRFTPAGSSPQWRLIRTHCGGEADVAASEMATQHNPALTEPQWLGYPVPGILELVRIDGPPNCFKYQLVATAAD